MDTHLHPAHRVPVHQIERGSFKLEPETFCQQRTLQANIVVDGNHGRIQLIRGGVPVPMIVGHDLRWRIRHAVAKEVWDDDRVLVRVKRGARSNLVTKVEMRRVKAGGMQDDPPAAALLNVLPTVHYVREFCRVWQLFAGFEHASSNRKRLQGWIHVGGTRGNRTVHAISSTRSGSACRHPSPLMWSPCVAPTMLLLLLLRTGVRAVRP